MAHSAYPELGESAIDKLLLALQRLRAMKLPVEEGIGPCTLNIGVIEGGRAPNVVPDKARAQLLYRLVGSSEQLKRGIVEAVGTLAKVEFVLEIPFVRLRTLDGLATMVFSLRCEAPGRKPHGGGIIQKTVRASSLFSRGQPGRLWESHLGGIASGPGGVPNARGDAGLAPAGTLLPVLDSVSYSSTR